jgi:hypothetical protein
MSVCGNNKVIVCSDITARADGMAAWLELVQRLGGHQSVHHGKTCWQPVASTKSSGVVDRRMTQRLPIGRLVLGACSGRKIGWSTTGAM